MQATCADVTLFIWLKANPSFRMVAERGSAMEIVQYPLGSSNSSSSPQKQRNLSSRKWNREDGGRWRMRACSTEEAAAVARIGTDAKKVEG